MLSVKKKKSKLPTSVNNTNVKNHQENIRWNIAVVSENEVTRESPHFYFLNNFMRFSNFFSEHALCLLLENNEF